MSHGSLAFEAPVNPYRTKTSSFITTPSPKSRHRAPHGSFMLCAIFFGHSAVSSSSQSMSFAPRPRKRDIDREFISLWMRFDEQHQQMWIGAKEPEPTTAD
jgi:hypothetical protein